MTDSDRQLVLEENFSHVLRPHLSTLSPTCIERLKNDAGVDVHKLKLHYPREVFDLTLKILAEEIYPTLPIEVATATLGEDLIAPYSNTILGKAVARLGSLLPLKTVIKRLPAAMRFGNTYVEAKLLEVSDSHYVFEMNEMGQYPHYWVGCLKAGHRMHGYPNAQAALIEYDGHHGRIRVQVKPE